MMASCILLIIALLQLIVVMWVHGLFWILPTALLNWVHVFNSSADCKTIINKNARSDMSNNLVR